MSDLNKVMLIGRLGADPEIRYTASGAAIANLRVATGEQWTDKQTGERKERTEWHRVVYFGRVAEICQEYLTKGSQIYVEGQNQTRKWQDSDGNDRYSTEIKARELKMLGGTTQRDTKPEGGAPEGGGFRDNPAPQEDAYAEDDIPF